jgi:hypothetical protein
MPRLLDRMSYRPFHQRRPDEIAVSAEPTQLRLQMKRLILHAGIPKTGSTSIQESLYYGLEDPRFHYIGFGQVNGTRAMRTLYSAGSELCLLHHRLGWTTTQEATLRHTLEQRLQSGLDRCDRRGATPIISAEGCWRMSSAELMRMKQDFESRGYVIEVLIYVRPLTAWYPSAFQEYIKWSGARFVPFDIFEELPGNRNEADLAAGLEIMDAVFTPERVQVAIFEKEYLVGGCVVQDFCQRLGIAFPVSAIRRANESLGLDATRLLYTFYSRGAGFGLGPRVVEENLMLHRRLQRLGGPPFRYHSSLLQSRAKFIAHQHAVIEQRVRFPFVRNTDRNDDQNGICEEADLLVHSPESLNWLVSHAGGDSGRSRATGKGNGAQTSDDVVALMDRLRRNPSFALRLGRWLELAQREWRRVRKGV